MCNVAACHTGYTWATAWHFHEVALVITYSIIHQLLAYTNEENINTINTDVTLQVNKVIGLEVKAHVHVSS
jgi:hypothetical protein